MKTHNRSHAIGQHGGKLALLGLLAASAAVMSLLPTNKAQAHGYLMGDAKSRALLCSGWEGEPFNANCGGSVSSNPNGIEYAPGVQHHFSTPGCSGPFPTCGPANQWISSGGLAGGFNGLNEQTASRWFKTRIKPGERTFTWKHTAPHATAYWEYYITKPGWNPNQPLTRDAFELNPIARFEGNSVAPPTKVDHKVTIPADRSGYHVLLSVWKTSPNGGAGNSFYQVVDLDIDNGDVTQPEWNVVGAMNPEPLLPGDKVGVRVFTAQGEVQPQPSMLVIDSEEKGDPNVWSYALATALNRTGNIGFRTGVLDDQGQVVANYGQNHFYVRPDSPVTRVEMVKYVADLPTTLRLSGLQDSYTITDGRVNLHYNAIATGNETYTINTSVFLNGKPVAYKVGSAGNNTHFSLTLDNATPGTYDVTASATVDNQYKAGAQHRFTVVEAAPAPEHDFVYPQGLGQYAAGTKVLQPKDGNVYECKPWPYTGWCNQYNATDPAYEPGTGRAWQEAWVRK